MSTSPAKESPEKPLTIPVLLNALHVHLQAQTQLLPTFHAQLGLPPSALSDELHALQQRLADTVEEQVQSRRNEVDDWMKRCDDVEKECSRYSKALGSHVKSVGATLGEIRKQQVLPVRFEMTNQYRDKVDQLYKAKLEQQTNFINRIVTLSRTLGPSFFAQDVIDFCPARGEPLDDLSSLRDVTPERFTRLDKEFYRGKAEISNRFHLMTEAFKKLDELYAILGMEPPSPDSLASSSLSLAPPNTTSCLTSLNDPFAMSISSLSTPTPHSRQSKAFPASFFDTSESVFDYQQKFCRYVLDLDREDPEGKMDDASRAKLLQDVEPSKGLLDWADQLIKELQAIETQRETQIESICEQLVKLWTRLNIEVDDMETFMEQHKGVTDDCVRAYEEELMRMMNLKRDSMEDFIKNAREEIMALWDELMISEAERRDFSPLLDTDYTDDLLTVHEEQISQLKEEREIKKLLLAKIRKYYELCDDEKTLEASAADQGRLRGSKGDPGRLLREEKTRKRVKREKPKVVDELLKKIPAWEAEHERPLLVNGLRFLDLLIEVECKENTKKPRAGSVPPRSKTPAPVPARPPSTGPEPVPQTIPNKRPRLASSSTRSTAQPNEHDPLPHRTPFSNRQNAGSIAHVESTHQGSVSKFSRTMSSSLPRPKSVTKISTGIPQRSGYGSNLGIGHPTSVTRTHPNEPGRSVSQPAPQNAPFQRNARATRRESFKPRVSVDSISFLNHKDIGGSRFKTSGYGSTVREEEEE